MSLVGLEALILAGGLGTRIRSVLGSVPKALAPISGVSFLTLLLRQLRQEGIERVILCLGHGGAMIVDHLKADPVPGIEMLASIEPRPLGTAGGLRHALDRIEGTTALVLNGDTFIELCWSDFSRFHRDRNAKISVACGEVKDRSQVGSMECAPEGAVTRVVEKDLCAHGPGWASAGLYLIERSVIESIPPDQECSLERDVFPAWVGQGLWAFCGVRKFQDIGTPEGLELARTRWSFLV